MDVRRVVAERGPVLQPQTAYLQPGLPYWLPPPTLPPALPRGERPPPATADMECQPPSGAGPTAPRQPSPLARMELEIGNSAPDEPRQRKTIRHRCFG